MLTGANSVQYPDDVWMMQLLQQFDLSESSSIYTYIGKKKHKQLKKQHQLCQ